MKKFIYIIAAFGITQSAVAQSGLGIGTSTPKALLHVDTGAVLFSAPQSLAAIPDQFPISGGGTRMMWYPKKAAFRAGTISISGTQWDKDSIGNYSTAFGYGTKAKGESSFAAGYGNYSIGDHSTALGFGNLAIGKVASTLGVSNEVTGNYSTAIGHGLSVKAWNSFAVGIYNDDSDPYSSTGTARLFQIGNGNYQYRQNALTILQNGNTGLGELNPDATLHVTANTTPLIPHIILEEEENDFARLSFKNSNSAKMWTIAASPQVANASSVMSFYYEGFGNVLRVYGDGHAILAGTLTQNSDLRLKTNIVELENSMQALHTISGYRYQWKDPSRDSSTHIGLLAQEVQQSFPELVKEDDKGILSVNYMGLIPVMIDAFKEQDKKIETLQRQVKILIERIEKSSALSD